MSHSKVKHFSPTTEHDGSSISTSAGFSSSSQKRVLIFVNWSRSRRPTGVSCSSSCSIRPLCRASSAGSYWRSPKQIWAPVYLLDQRCRPICRRSQLCMRRSFSGSLDRSIPRGTQRPAPPLASDRKVSTRFVSGGGGRGSGWQAVLRTGPECCWPGRYKGKCAARKLHDKIKHW